MNNFLDDLIKIRIESNGKRPINKWTNPENQFRGPPRGGNYGILTGLKNNLIVIDIDTLKNDSSINDGFKEILKYEREHGIINTYTTRTPSGGLHYYFKILRNNKEPPNYQFLKNKSKYRNSSIDIRNNGGYIIGPGSIINNNVYSIINDIEPATISDELINFLIEYETIEQIKIKPESTKEQNNNINENVIYEIEDDQIINLLNQLNIEYKRNFNKWLLVCSAMKSLNKWAILDNYSKGEQNYNRANNKDIYKKIKPSININFIVNILNKDRERENKIELIKFYKPVINEWLMNPSYNKKFINAEHLTDLTANNGPFSYNDFKKYSTLILQSGTGTGKTSGMAKYCEAIRTENNKLKILTITDKINLSSQHISSFKEKNIILKDYRDSSGALFGDDLTICINSINRLNITVEEMKNYIIYIDEISSLINFTHNKLVDVNNIVITKKLIDLINNCYKLVLSDNFINDSLFKLIKHRHGEMLILINEFKKYKDKEAIKVDDENIFKQTISDHLEHNNYFFYGSDSKKTIKKDYYNFINKYESSPEIINNMLLITGDGIAQGGNMIKNFKLTNPSEQFKNKYLFYSPSITTALDYSQDTPQDVFININGSSITACDIYQQTSRTRNINKVYYFSKSTNKPPKYENICNVEEQTKDSITIYNNNNMTLFNDYSENLPTATLCGKCNNDSIYNDIFKQIFINNEYILDCLKTSTTAQYENFLIKGGFNIIKTNKPLIKLTNEINKRLESILKDYDDLIFNQFLKAEEAEELADEKKIIKQYEYKEDYKTFKSNIDFLKLDVKDDDEMMKYKKIIQDEHEKIKHIQIIHGLESTQNLENRIIKTYNNTQDLTSSNGFFNKLITIRRLVEKFNIPLFNIKLTNENIINYTEQINFTDEDLKTIKTFFKRTTKEQRPKNKYELINFVVALYKNLLGFNIFIKARIKIKKKDYISYSLDRDLIQYNIDLLKKRNKYLLYLHPEIYEILNIENPDGMASSNNKDDPFNDEGATISLLDV